MTYTELRWWVTDYAPFEKVLQSRVVKWEEGMAHVLVPWTKVPTVNMPKPYEDVAKGVSHED